MESLYFYSAFILLNMIAVIVIAKLQSKKMQEELRQKLDTPMEYLKSSLYEKMQTNDELLLSKLSETQLKQQHQIQESFVEKLNQIQEVNQNSQQKQFQVLDHFRASFLEELKKDFLQLNQTLEKKLMSISDRVNESLEEGLKKSQETFHNVLERLTKIDEAQKKIEQLSTNVVSLQDVLTDKKSRGIWGEVQLNQILQSVFGDNSKLFSLQYKLNNSNIVDAMLFLPEPTGMLAVDSKFPLENYKRMHDKSLDESARELAAKEFKKNIKKHIDDISSKYIDPRETGDQAIMFIPAEAIFSELHAYFSDLIDYANQKKVWITSPTTFMAVLSTIQVVMNNMERTKYAHIIHEELNKLGQEFKRYQVRWNKLANHLDMVGKDVKDIHITTDKLTERFGKITNVELEPHSSTMEIGSV